MRIQMPQHEIKTTQQININEIPLSYINIDDIKLTTEINIDNNFLNESSIPIRAYTEIKDPDILFFSKDKSILKDIELKRYGNTYIYEPKDIVEFTPATFECNVLIKKNMTFKSSQNYNIKVSVIEDNKEITYAPNMIKLFADAYRRGIAPPNITINNQSLKPESLISSTLLDNDFIFARSPDGVNIVNEDDEVIQEINIQDLLNNHVNVWLSVDSFGDMLVKSNTEDFSITYDKFLLFNRKSYPQSSTDKIYFFNELSTNKDYPISQYSYEFLSNSILVIEKKNCGYLIVTPTFLLNNLEDNACLIYEVLLNIFLRSYYKSATVSSWIVDEAIDYMAYSYKKINLYHKTINLTDLLRNNNYEINGQYSLISINISNENVKFKNLAPNGNMFFYKVGTKDPKKNINEISYLTTKQTVVLYKQEDIYLIEDKLNIDSNIVDSIAYITVHPYCSSSHKIHTKNDQTFTLTDLNIQYYICVKESSPEIENTFVMVPMDQYSYDKHGYILAYITLKSEKDTKLYDIRILGGGLPLSERDNYNLIDIGNVYGRPYRIGSTMIIKLPKICKQYDTIIKQAINKHISSGDYPVIIYK